jgi:POT family proton-dependent oligopeptide transporter
MEFGELCVGPIVYALTYKLSPVEIAGTTMGVLGIAAALGEWLATKIGSLTSVPANITDPVKILPYYTHVYSALTLLSVGVAVLFLLLSPLMRKWMGDVR